MCPHHRGDRPPGLSVQVVRHRGSRCLHIAQSIRHERWSCSPPCHFDEQVICLFENRTHGPPNRLHRNPLCIQPQVTPRPTLITTCRRRSLKGNSSIAQGSPRSGYPGLGPSITHLNPNGVRLRGNRGNRSSSIGLRTPVRWVEFRPYLSSAARVKPALSGLSRSGGPVTQGSAAHEPWAMKECPFRTWLGGTLLMRAGRSVTQIDRGADQSGFVLCPLVRGSSDECPAGGHRGPRGCGTGLSACSSKSGG